MEEWAMKYILLTICISISVFCNAVNAETYHNERFEFDVEIPEGITLCNPTPPSTEPGITLLLDSNDCTNREKLSHIDVYGSYNPETGINETEKASNEICHGSTIKKTNISNNGISFYSCKIKTNNVNYIYFTLKPEKNNSSLTEIVAIQYCITKKCDDSLLKDIVTGISIKRE
jgi:hypothetical protein